MLFYKKFFMAVIIKLVSMQCCGESRAICTGHCHWFSVCSSESHWLPKNHGKIRQNVAYHHRFSALSGGWSVCRIVSGPHVS
jgi:hypothetical protein